MTDLFRMNDKRKYWKADGTFEERAMEDTIQIGDYYQWRDGTWRHRSATYDFSSVPVLSLPAPIQMALLLLDGQ